MRSWARSALLLAAVVIAALLLSPLAPAAADTTAPTPSATATATPTSPADPEDADAPDVALDNTRTILVLAGAGVLALLAGTVVFLRR